MRMNYSCMQHETRTPITKNRTAVETGKGDSNNDPRSRPRQLLGWPGEKPALDKLRCPQYSPYPISAYFLPLP